MVLPGSVKPEDPRMGECQRYQFEQQRNLPAATAAREKALDAAVRNVRRSSRWVDFIAADGYPSRVGMDNYIHGRENCIYQIRAEFRRIVESNHAL